MKTSQDDKCSDKTKETGAVRMGREVSSKKASAVEQANSCQPAHSLRHTAP
jgi:hypothetical protein